MCYEFDFFFLSHAQFLFMSYLTRFIGVPLHILSPHVTGYPETNCTVQSRVTYCAESTLTPLLKKYLFDLGERKLRLAANTNDADRLRSLLDSGIDPKSCDEFQRTALHLAASKGYTEIVRFAI